MLRTRVVTTDGRPGSSSWLHFMLNLRIWMETDGNALDYLDLDNSLCRLSHSHLLPDNGSIFEVSGRAGSEFRRCNQCYRKKGC